VGGSAITVRAVADDATAVEVVLPSDAVGPDGASAEDELTGRWPPRGLRRREGGRLPQGEMTDEVERLVLGARGDAAAWDRLESDLGLFAAERLADRVALHAALVVIGGVAVVLPGRSYSGKSTLAVALATAAPSASSSDPVLLASDEYTLIDPATGLVEGWPRPARLRADGPGARRRHPSTVLEAPVRVGMVALLRYDADLEGALDVAPLDPSAAVLALLDETVCARSRPDESLTAALALTSTPGVMLMRGRRGGVEHAAPELARMLRGHDR